MNKSDYVRAFIALETQESVKRAIREVQDKLRVVSGARVTWVRSVGVHLTLKFLGDVEVSQLSEIEASIRDSASRISPFNITTTNTGGFPNLKKPRVLWLGVDGGRQLLELQNNIEKALEPLGFPMERKKFHPHLTIGRVKSINRDCILAGKMTEFGFQKITWEINEVRLMSSILKPDGAEYGIIANIPI
ncbi:MAG: RNA 2',3'-cyclic phosphodiesterase [Candidatus Hatepunaea meridiana]|nr:RNA 2',3'-cyclic phosphodiesterase [Candidatus Hatepunaea meridiana]